MPEITVRRVSTRAERRAFLTFPWRIYRDDPVWVPPLLPERKKRTDPARGPFFEHGTAEFFVAWRGREAVGTICAAEDRQRNGFLGIHDAIFGFFDCVEDYSVAAALFETAAGWAREHGLDALLGPFNLDYEDGYGIVLEGHCTPQVLLCGQTPPYYRDFVERYGFEPGRGGDNIAYRASLEVAPDDPRLERYARVAHAAERRGHVTVRPARLDDWDTEIDHALRVLNKGLAVLPDFSPWDRDVFAEHAGALRAIMDPDLVVFGLVDGEPVGWALGLPNLNEAVQKANGLRHVWDYGRLWWYARRQPECMCFKSIAVDPAHWGRGVDAAMVNALVRASIAKGYKWMDLSLTSSDNPMTPLLAERMGAELYRRYRVYRLPLAEG
jgi:GNAT superfamily N-acetyltransferase